MCSRYEKFSTVVVKTTRRIIFKDGVPTREPNAASNRCQNLSASSLSKRLFQQKGGSWRDSRQDSNGSTEPADPVTGYANQATSPGTISGTVDARDAALRLLVDAWPGLSDGTVSSILRMAQNDGAASLTTGRKL